MSTPEELRSLADGARQVANELAKPEDRELARQYAVELEAKAEQEALRRRRDMH